MKDVEKRPKGKYTETFEKEVDGVKYTKVETTIVGRDFEILNFQREYNPAIVFPMSWEQL